MGDFELLGQAGDETRLVRHACGYSIPLPARPEVAPSLGSDWPAADIVIRLGAAPVEVTFRLDELPGDTQPDPLAQSLVFAYATGRAAGEPTVHVTDKGQRGPGVDGSATAIYPIDGTPSSMEECHVTVHRDDGKNLAVVRTIRFDRQRINSIVWAQLHSSLRATEQWDAANPRVVPPPLWPEHSALAAPGVELQLRPELVDDTRAKARALSSIPEGEGGTLVQLLVSFATNPDAPRFEIQPLVLQSVAQQLGMAVPSREIAAALTSNLSQVKTMHDVRAWVWQCMVAFDRRHQSDW